QVLHPCLEDNFLARAELEDGTWVSLEVSKYTHSVSCWLEVVGEEAQLLADYRLGGITVIRGGEAERIQVDGNVPTLPAVLTAWLAAIRGEAPLPVTAEDGLRTLEMVEACYRSSRERRAIQIQP
ncbi:MAG: Gfo/Idh/MocA family oxidoreductase, partial [bacterium]